MSEDLRRRQALGRVTALDRALSRLPQKWWIRKARATLKEWAALLGKREEGRPPHWAYEVERRIAKIDRNADVPAGQTARTIAELTGEKLLTVARRLRPSARRSARPSARWRGGK